VRLRAGRHARAARLARIFEATAADIADLGEERGYRVLCVCGKGIKVVLVTLPPPAGRSRPHARPGPAHSSSRWIDRYAATRRLRRLAGTTGIHGHQAAIPECCATRCHD
jgi:hypothetical protein